LVSLCLFGSNPNSCTLAANTTQPKSILSPSTTGPAQPAAQSPSTFGTAAAPIPTITIPVPNSLPAYKSLGAPKTVLTPTPSAPSTVNMQSASQFLTTPSLSVIKPLVNNSTPASGPAATSSQLNLTPSSSPLSTLPTITSGTSSFSTKPTAPTVGPGLGTAAPSISGTQPAKTGSGVLAPTTVSH
jgi:hypothetical protein